MNILDHDTKLLQASHNYVVKDPSFCQYVVQDCYKIYLDCPGRPGVGWLAW